MFQALCLIIQGSLLKPHMILSPASALTLSRENNPGGSECSISLTHTSEMCYYYSSSHACLLIESFPSIPAD